MSTTKNGRIRKLLFKNKAKRGIYTAGKIPPGYSVTTLSKRREENDENRATEIKRLDAALGTRIVRAGEVPFYDSPAKKPRMRKFSHRKSTPKPEKQGGKKGGK